MYVFANGQIFLPVSMLHFRNMKIRSHAKMLVTDTKFNVAIGLATKWLRILSLPPNDKTRNHLVANPIVPIKHVNSINTTIHFVATVCTCTRYVVAST